MKAIVISASSDIGAALCRRWVSNGWTVSGTYRSHSQTVANLKKDGVCLVECDLADQASIKNAAGQLMALVSGVGRDRDGSRNAGTRHAVRRQRL